MGRYWTCIAAGQTSHSSVGHPGFRRRVPESQHQCCGSRLAKARLVVSMHYSNCPPTHAICSVSPALLFSCFTVFRKTRHAAYSHVRNRLLDHSGGCLTNCSTINKSNGLMLGSLVRGARLSMATLIIWTSIIGSGKL